MPSSRASGRFRSRAAARARKVEVEAVSLMVPVNAEGRPTKLRSHPSVTSSSSVAAGELFQTMAFTLSAAARSSPRIPGPDPETAK